MAWVILGVVVALVLYRLLTDPARNAKKCWLCSIRAQHRKDWKQAEWFCHEGLEQAAKLKEPRRSQWESQLEVQLAGVLHRQGKLAEAEETLARGMSKGRKLSTPPAEAMIEAMIAAQLLWGDLCSDTGRHTEAEEHYRIALEGDEANDHLSGAIVDLQRLSDCLIRQERLRKAEQVILQAIGAETRHARQLAVEQGVILDEHQFSPESLPKLQFCRGQYEDSIRLFRSQIDHSNSQATSPNSIDAGEMLMHLALAESRAGHLTLAAAAYERAAAQFAADWCEAHPKALAALGARAATGSPLSTKS
jgi:tetratricopeptide (TPR) repeat protein